MRIALLLLVFSACHARDQASSEARRVELRDQARLVLERTCGECHIPGQSKLDRPLAVFDLMEPEWTTTATDAQLANIAWRLKEPTIPGGEDGRPNDATDAERKIVEAYVELELARRAAR
ncbi:MAG: hypothetical protein IT381_26250 [Deltaproteobacteria bacterium]|nr:hypothetical protein [Deltaproteobacteria bacterium]